MTEEDPDDVALLKDMAKEARQYLQSHDWCPPIRKLSLGYGVGGVVALFHAELAHAIDGTDDELWVAVGDLPSAYFVVKQVDACAEIVIGKCRCYSNEYGHHRWNQGCRYFRYRHQQKGMLLHGEGAECAQDANASTGKS